VRRATRFRRSFRRRGSLYEMQQLSICREPLELSGDATCSQPDPFFVPLVSAASEHAAQGEVPAFAKGVSLGGIKFRYAFSFNSGTVSTPQATDLCTIHSALVLFPRDPSAGDLSTPLLPPSGFLFAQKTFTESAGTQQDQSSFRVLWRGLDKLKLFPDLSGPFGARMESTAYGGQGTQLQDVRTKCKVDMDHVLCWYIEIAYGLLFDQGTNSPILAADLFGVAAVKNLVRGR